MKKRISAFLTAGLIVAATAAGAAVREGEISISPVIGGYTFDGKQHLDTNMVYGGRLGYTFTRNIGIEGLFDYVRTDSTLGSGSAKAYRYGAELVYNFLPDNVLVPFLALGGGAETIDGNAAKKTRGMYDFGGGLKYFITDRFALRGDLRYILNSDNGSTIHNAEYTLGAYIPFGGVKPAVKPVEPPPVMESAQPKAAPAAPAVVVAPPASTLSALPATITSGQPARLSWTSQNATECAIQPGIGPVPLQGDRAVTPDADTSYTLTCTGEGGTTTSRAAVAVTAPPPKPVMQSAQKASAAAQRFCNKPAILQIAFDTNKTDIKPKYHGELKTLGDFLAEFPNAKGEIAGHTDNVGGKAFNLKLSQRRADSVKTYLVKKFGIAAERISTKGYGFSKPIASNKTKAGKAKNRRIEANFTCGD